MYNNYTPISTEELLGGWYLLYRPNVNFYQICQDNSERRLPASFAPPRLLDMKDIHDGYFYTFSEETGYGIGRDFFRKGCLGIWYHNSSDEYVTPRRRQRNTPMDVRKDWGELSTSDRSKVLSSSKFCPGILRSYVGVIAVSQLSRNCFELSAWHEDAELLRTIARSTEDQQLLRDQQNLKADQEGLRKRQVELQEREKDLQSRENALSKRETEVKEAKDATDRTKSSNARILADLKKREAKVEKRENAIGTHEPDLQASMQKLELEKGKSASQDARGKHIFDPMKINNVMNSGDEHIIDPMKINSVINPRDEHNIDPMKLNNIINPRNE